MAETVEITTKSGRSFTLRELNGLEISNADAAAREPMAMLNFRVAMALASIDGVEQLPAKNDLDLQARLQSLTGRELSELVEAYAKTFVLTDEALKNGFTGGGFLRS